jgi:hypothetical protein
MVFGDVPPLNEVLAGAERFEQIVNGAMAVAPLTKGEQLE